MTKREARILARRYVVGLLRAQGDKGLDWVADDMPDDLDSTFSEEIKRIADRIERTIP